MVHEPTLTDADANRWSPIEVRSCAVDVRPRHPKASDTADALLAPELLAEAVQHNVAARNRLIAESTMDWQQVIDDLWAAGWRPGRNVAASASIAASVRSSHRRRAALRAWRASA